MKLYDSELKVMDILWSEGNTSAKKLAEMLSMQVGWSKTTTYTVIKKCIEKGAIARDDPGFLCSALVSRENAQDAETKALVDKLYGGSEDRLIASLLGRKNLSTEKIEELRLLVKEMGCEEC